MQNQGFVVKPKSDNKSKEQNQQPPRTEIQACLEKLTTRTLMLQRSPKSEQIIIEETNVVDLTV
ncbi:hypothetical protein TSUD_37780 [Trifolium subterraneum]|uniref:Uncharacterized protein n=1 Tax=Trifolium subterraneum TaxID=3900 RepID=A0A2Z6LIF2_TRISU|nr:hypothetical protein TSUD_37780 [Trifolium subterraneum]